jgi:uncharacterized protein (TIGR02118 family)
MIKSISLLTRRPELSHDEFVRHWVEIHAPLAHAVPGVRRYVQNHIEGERRRADIPTTEIAVDGIAELWYDDRAAMDRGNASAEAKRLHDDGALFIGGIKSFIVEEKGDHPHIRVRNAGVSPACGPEARGPQGAGHGSRYADCRWVARGR